jgi:hypothetical protein
MTERLTFPEYDAKQLAEDCDDLKSIVLLHLEPHCAWLRALAAANATEEIAPAQECGPEQIDAVLQTGFAVALKSGAITPAMLRGLARDPNMLEVLAERVFAEGKMDVWFGKEASVPPTGGVDALAAEFFKALGQVDPSTASSTEAPSIETSELRRAFPAVPLASSQLAIWTIEATVMDDATLTLRFRGRTWGKMMVKRKGETEIEVLSRSGIFLSQGLPMQLRLRAAADSVSSPMISQPALELQVIRAGILVRINVPLLP